MLLSAAAQAWFGRVALAATLALSGLVDAHAASASAAQLVAAGRVSPEAALTGIALAFGSNSFMKLVMAWISGGRAYALRLLPGIVAMLAAFVLGVWLG
jgi:uncharacterized membrane protein (DUF4010 family)